MNWLSLRQCTHLRFYSDHKFVNKARSGCSNFVNDYQATHLETTSLQRALLAFGSAFLSIYDPKRGDMIAVLGETTGTSALSYIQSKMSDSEEGRRILQEKPRISSASIDLQKLKAMPDGTLGKVYSNFLERYNYTPDARMAVRFVDDVELAFVIQRYREVHDLFHALLNMPTNMLGEVTVKWVEAIQTKLPMCIGGALFGPLRLAPKGARMYSSSCKPHFTPAPLIEQEDSAVKGNRRAQPWIMQMPCVDLPLDIARTIQEILQEHDLKRLAEEAKLLRRYLNARKRPVEEEEVATKRKEAWDEVVEKFNVDVTNLSSEAVEHLKQVQSQHVEKLVKSRVYNWTPVAYTRQRCLQYLLARAAADYAVVTKVFNEISKRDVNFQPKTLFDFGSGVGTVSWAAHAYWGQSLNEYFTVDVSADMNDLALLILQGNNSRNKSFLKTLYQRQFLPTSRKKYDLVVSAYSLTELENTKTRMSSIINLWNRTSQYLVLIEPGTNAGFGLISEARDFLLHMSEKTNTPCHVFSPCPHDMTCPRLGDKTPCNFSVKYREDNNSKGVTEVYSYVVLSRGPREGKSPSWARIVRPVLNRHKHTICRVCTQDGDLKEIIFSQGKQGKAVYRCCKMCSWGDLLPGQLNTTMAGQGHNQH